jgi:hypothetical protein
MGSNVGESLWIQPLSERKNGQTSGLHWVPSCHTGQASAAAWVMCQESCTAALKMSDMIFNVYIVLHILIWDYQLPQVHKTVVLADMVMWPPILNFYRPMYVLYLFHLCWGRQLGYPLVITRGYSKPKTDRVRSRSDNDKLNLIIYIYFHFFREEPIL